MNSVYMSTSDIKRTLTAVVASLLLSTAAQADIVPGIFNLLPIQECTPETFLEIERSPFMFPQMSHHDYMGLHGNVESLVTTRRAYDSGFAFADKASDTISLNANGMITRIAMLRYNYDGKLMPTATLIIQYDGALMMKSVYEHPEENINVQGFAWSRDIKDFRRNSQGQLTQVYQTYYWGPSLQELELQDFATKPLIQYTYDQQGRLSSITGDILNNFTLHLNTKGQLTVCKAPANDPNKVPPTKFTYDQQGRMASASQFNIDGMDDVFNYEQNVAFTYNEKGDPVKVTNTMWRCNNSWTRSRREFSSTYAITYEYDKQGNWTKATVKKTEGGKVKVTDVFTRTLKYRSADSPIAQTPAVESESRPTPQPATKTQPTPQQESTANQRSVSTPEGHSHDYKLVETTSMKIEHDGNGKNVYIVTVTRKQVCRESTCHSVVNLPTLTKRFDTSREANDFRRQYIQ